LQRKLRKSLFSCIAESERKDPIGVFVPEEWCEIHRTKEPLWLPP